MENTNQPQQKKSRVSRILHNTRSYNTQNGQLYVHEITFENGDKGGYSSKSETCTKFTEGQEASYTIETKQNGQYTNVIIKPATEFVPNTTGFKKSGSGSDESFALSYAKDVWCSKIESGSGLGQKEITAKDVIATAEEFYNWLKSKKA